MEQNYEIRIKDPSPSMGESIQKLTGTYQQAVDEAHRQFQNCRRRTSVVTGTTYWHTIDSYHGEVVDVNHGADCNYPEQYAPNVRPGNPFQPFGHNRYEYQLYSYLNECGRRWIITALDHHGPGESLDGPGESLEKLSEIVASIVGAPIEFSTPWYRDVGKYPTTYTAQLVKRQS